MHCKLVLSTLLFQFCTLPVLASDWRQFGGPNRNFTVPSTDLASNWPDSGPKRLWSRELGEGYSAITVDGNLLYTLYRRGNTEIVITLDSRNGETLWEHSYSASFGRGYNVSEGPGPHAAPLVVGNRLFTVGSLTDFLCLDKATGEVIWSHNFLSDFGASQLDRGYASSPVAFQDKIILPVGGRGHSVMAFRQHDGTVAWQSGDFRNAYSSPVLIDVGGQTQVVSFMSSEVAGFDAETGHFLWSHPHTPQYGLNISMPLWGEDDVLFISAAYGAGAKGLRLIRQGEGTRVDEVWQDNRMRVHFGNALRLGDTVYGSSGDFGPAPFSALDINTGDILWRERSLGKSSFVYADEKLILLEEDGDLLLATIEPDGLTIHSRSKLFSGRSWTGPTLVGTTLFARDRKEIVALDLGR